MGFIKKIELPDNNIYDIKNTIIPVVGTQSAATGNWTGNIDIPALYDGLTISYFLPWPPSGYASLNLTLNDGTTTGAINCYYNYNRLTTHFAKGSNIIMTYYSAGSISIDGVATTDNRWIAQADYTSDSTGYYLRRIYPNLKAGTNKIFPFTMIMQNADGRWESIVTSSTVNSIKTRNTHGFRLGQVLLMYANATYNADALVGTYNIWTMHSGLIDHRYSFNTENNATKGTTGYKPVYLVGTINNSDGLFYLDETWWTQTLPSTDNGKVYIYIGDAYDYYRMTFVDTQKIYKYTNGALREISQDAITVNGHAVNKDVPSDAIFTDTTYSAGTGISLSGTTFSINNSAIAPYEANLQWGGKNFSDGYGCIDAAMVSELGANRLMFSKPQGITIEYSRDDGATWIDYEASDSQKLALFSTGEYFPIGKADSTNKATANGTKYQLRVTLATSTAEIYTELHKFIICVSTDGSNDCTVTMQRALESSPTNFSDFATNIPLSGWWGYNVINVPPFRTYGNNPNWQYGRIRFIFKANGGDTNHTGLKIAKIMGFGGVGWTTPSTMARTGHLYNFNQFQDAFFPANVKIRNDKQIGYFTTTPTTNQVIITDGTIGGIKSSGYTIAKSVPSDAVFTDTTYNIFSKIIDANYKNEFRTQTKGDANPGYYITAIRQNTASVDASPQWSSGLAIGNNDTHGYLMFNFNSDGLYVGGGNAGKLNWTSRVYTTNYKPTAADVGAATSGHTHAMTLVTDTGTSAITLAHGSKYKLTAGGSSVIFTMPTDNNTNYYHTTGSWSGLTYTATANGGAGALAFTIPTGTTSTTVALGNHTHPTTIAAGASSDTNQLTLAFGTKYKLTAGGTNFIFTTPSNPNTDTTYTFANGTNGFTVTPSGGVAQTVTVTPSIANNITGSGINGKIAKFTGTNTIGNGYGVDTTVTSESDNLITSGAVYDAIADLPEPMVFKGSLGTGGTITTLPVNGSAKVGDTYKVITDGTYNGQTAKVGDLFICDSKTSSVNTWTYIPSADEPSGTVTSIIIKATSPIAIDSSSAITTSGTRTISHADSGVSAGTYKSVTVNATGHITSGTNPTTLSGYGITDAKISNGTITLGSNTITPLTSHQSVTDNNPTLSWGTKSKVATIGSTEINVTMPSNPNTDRYVNSASFAHDSTNNNVKMTLTRAGSDTNTVIANIPKVSSSTAGVAPKGAAVSSQSQSTKFLREDGSWAAPSYTTNTDTKNTAGSTDTTDKIFLIGAKSQAANPQTYSDSQVYVTNGSLFLTKPQDASGTADNKPALLIGNSTGAHLEFDTNEIMAKATDTTTGPLYLNNDGGLVYANNKKVVRLTSDPTSGQVMIADGTDGQIKSSGYTIAANVPSGAVFTDEKVKTNLIAPEEGKFPIYYLTATGNTTESAKQLFMNENVRIRIQTGTASTLGRAIIILGNSTEEGTAGNCCGQLQLHSTDSGFSVLRQATGVSSSGITIYLPPKSGTIFNTGSLVAGDNITLTESNGVYSINGTANTDTKVSQTATTTSANYEILFSATADNTTRTEGARKTSGLKYNPDSDRLWIGRSGTSSGSIALYGSTGGLSTYGVLKQSYNPDGNNVTHTFPTVGGYVFNSGNVSAGAGITISASGDRYTIKSKNKIYLYKTHTSLFSDINDDSFRSCKYFKIYYKDNNNCNYNCITMNMDTNIFPEGSSGTTSYTNGKVFTLSCVGDVNKTYLRTATFHFATKGGGGVWKLVFNSSFLWDPSQATGSSLTWTSTKQTSYSNSYIKIIKLEYFWEDA